jgi:hypothetical protein
MPEHHASPVAQFNCPNCNAMYDLVRVEAESVTADRELACLTCEGPLRAREGRFVLKYFLREPYQPSAVHDGRRA